MNLDDLLGIGDVVPVPVGLPTFRDNLNEDAPDGRLRNVGDALHVGLDVDFRLFVFNQMIFLRLEIDAGVLNGLVRFAAGDFDGETRNWRRGWCFFLGRSLLRGRRSARGEEEENKAS